MNGPGGGSGLAGAEVAIVGMAGLFPGAPDIGTFWRNIVGKVSALGDPPPGWAGPGVFDPASREPDRIYCQRGGFLRDLSRFDPTAYGVMPLSVDGAEPEHFLALRVAHEALADAGYLTRAFPRERTGVVLGRGTFLNRGSVTALQHGLVADQTLALLRQVRPDLGEADLGEIRRQLKASLPPFNAETAPGLVSNVMCGRIANRLDLRGPNYAVDAACASSLVAVDLGVRELQSGRADLMLVGGVSVSTPPIVFMVFCQLGALSRRGQIRPFDAEADGVLLGEGIGMVVLKRRADAERDGDRIYAVIKGVGLASDGRALAVLAPRVEGEELALRNAYAAADVAPDTIGLIEAHGTGTPVGDATEMEALGRVFGARRGRFPQVALGSVKSMIGHTIPAAGVAGLIKVALALHQRTLPPTIGVERPHPAFGLPRTSFCINTETRPWIHGGLAPRRAGVNAFGFGGINAHVVLEEAGGEGPDLTPEWDSEVMVLTGRSRAELIARATELGRTLSADPDGTLLTVAATVNAAIPDDSLRLAIVATSLADLRAKLAYASERLADPDCRRIRDVSGVYYFDEPLGRQGGVAFLFPGEGAQYVNMLADLCRHFPEVRECFDQADRIFAASGQDYVPSQILFPAALEAGSEDPALWDAPCAVAAVFAANRALAALLGRLGVRADAVVGHSSGEYAALLHSGAMALQGEGALFAAGVELNRLYGAIEQKVPRAVLLTVGAARPDAVRALLAERPESVQVAMDNCRHQVVLCLEPAAADWATERLRAAGAICAPLPFGRAYHTPRFGPVAQELERFFDGLPTAPPSITTYSCAIAAPFPDDPARIRQVAVAQWSMPVRFRETVQAMHAAGVRVFIEVGPRGLLTGFVDDTLRGRPYVAVAMNAHRRSGLTQLNHAVAQMAAHGLRLRLEPLYERRCPRHPDLASRVRAVAAPQPPMAVSLALPVARLAGPLPAGVTLAPEPIPGGPSPEAGGLPDGGRLPGPAVPGLAAASERERAVLEHLETMERFLEVQQAVATAFLEGASALAPPAPAWPAAPGPAALRADAPEVVAVEAARGPVPAPRVADGGLDREGLASRLRRVVSERTGYPEEMLELSLDLEADLGIDSIKRVEILGSFLRLTGLMRPEAVERASSLKTLGQIVDLAVAEAVSPSTGMPSPGRVSATTPDQGPFVGRVLSFTAGAAVMAECELGMGTHAFLADHAMGGRPSALDTTLSALPVVPLAVSVEIMAEVGALLRPGVSLVGMRDVRASRWFQVDAERRRVVVQARRLDAADDAVAVQILDPGEDRGAPPGPVLAEGVMVYGRTPDAAAEPLSPRLTGPRPFGFGVDALYREVLFHGPLFQGVRSLDRSGEDGAEATVASGRATRLLDTLPAGVLLDPVLLDTAGQVVGAWAADRLGRAFVVFPVGFRSLTVHDGAREAQQVLCRTRTQVLAGDRLRSDMDFLGPDGLAVLQVRGWEDRRFDFPREVVRFVLQPARHALSEAWPEAVEGLGGDLECCRLWPGRLPPDMFDPGSPLRPEVLGRLVLTRAEQKAWARVGAARRQSWFLGRLVAKDAVRRLVARRHGLVLAPADVEILADEHGTPTVTGQWLARVGVAPFVSVAHTPDLVVAVAGPADAGRVGVDVEPARALAEDLVDAAFGPEERALLPSRDPAAAQEWLVRAWCAKEAVGKALGRGLPGGPRSARIDGVAVERGTVTVAPGPELCQAAGLAAGAVMTAWTRRDGTFILAAARAGSR